MNVNLCNPLQIWVRAVNSFIIQMVVEDCHQWLCVSGQCSSSRRAFAPALLRGWVRARAWHRPVTLSSDFRTGSPARVRKMWLSRRINIFNSRLPSGIYRVDFITAPHDLFPTRETWKLFRVSWCLRPPKASWQNWKMVLLNRGKV